MPPVRQRPTRAGRAGTAPVGEIQPDEVAKIRASVQGREQAPSSRQLAGSNANWAKVRDVLGDPFDTERIPISRLRLMRRDPMLAFGLNYIKVPLVQAEWHISASDVKGPNAQVAANVDWALRRIYASLAFQYSRGLDFGWSAMAKRWENRRPAGTYISATEGGEQVEEPLWNEGGIDPLVWKSFVALAPEVVEPIWTGAGEFGGILYNQEGAPANIGAVQQGDKASFKIDLYHSLWATHEKDSNDGSIFGYPRLGYAFRYWWSYWFRWAQSDRAFEMRGDPSTVVKHPDGEFEEEDGTLTPYREYALSIGEALRSGAVVAIPSDTYVGEIDGKPSNVPLWAIESLKDMTDFDPFDKSFDYLDIQKIRSLWIPEQAFFEGKGATSSRNVAAENFGAFTSSQAVNLQQFGEMINRWMIPQFLATNFPEFVADGGNAEIVFKSLEPADADTRNNIIQLVGQQEVGAREMLKLVDLKKLLEEAGTPILPFAEQQRMQKLLVEQQQAAQPPTVEPVPGQEVGVVPSSTGFNSYIQPREVIYLSDSSSSFLERLPSTDHYADSKIRRASRELWTSWSQMYEEDYNSFADYLEAQNDLQFSDVSDNARKAARAIVRAWESNNDKLGKVLDKTTDVYKRVLSRTAALKKQDAKLDTVPTDEALEQWIKNHAAEFVSRVSFTTREELTDFIAKRIDGGDADPADLAQEIREHFKDFPGWKADRLARTEVREAFNAATIMTAQANGIKQLQAVDGTSDPECEERNGKIFSVEDALEERDHPNGTLAWRLMPVELSQTFSDELPEGVTGFYDDETATVIFSRDASPQERSEYMLAIGSQLAAA